MLTYRIFIVIISDWVKCSTFEYEYR